MYELRPPLEHSLVPLFLLFLRRGVLGLPVCLCTHTRTQSGGGNTLGRRRPHLTKRVFVFGGDDYARNHRERFALPKLKASLAAHTHTHIHRAHTIIEGGEDSDIRLLRLD